MTAEPFLAADTIVQPVQWTGKPTLDIGALERRGADFAFNEALGKALASSGHSAECSVVSLESIAALGPIVIAARLLGCADRGISPFGGGGSWRSCVESRCVP